MEQRDFLKNQIDQIGKILGKIISDFFDVQSTKNFSTSIQTMNIRLQTELNIDLKKIIFLSKIELKDYLHKSLVKPENFEMLSELLKEIGKSNSFHKKQRNAYLYKAIELLEIVDETSNTLSFERLKKKNQIEMMIKNNN